VRRQTPASNAPVLLESLEGRQMMAVHIFTALTKLADRTFTDNLGNKVVFNLTGPGVGTLVQDELGNFDTLELDGTSSTKSSLSIAVTKGKDSTVDSTLIGNIEIADSDTADGGLIAFNAAKVNIDSGFFAEGVVRTLTLNNVGDGEGQAGVHVGGTSSTKIAMTFGQITDTLITSTSGVSSFRALDWQDTNDSIDAFEVASVTSITITGRLANPVSKVSKLNGDLEANIDLSYVPPLGSSIVPVTSVTVAGSARGDWNFKNSKASTINIKGDVGSEVPSTWASVAGFGSITIGGTTTNLTINTGKAVGSILAGTFNNVFVNAVDRAPLFDLIGTIGAIKVVAWNGGKIDAGTVASITTTGKAATKSSEAIAGNFSASLLVVGISERPNAISMGPIRIQGNAYGTSEGVDWQFAGGVGAISIQGKMHDMQVQTDSKGGTKGSVGNVASLQVIGAVDNVSVSISGKIGNIDVASASMLSVSADSSFKLGSIGNFTSKGPVTHTKLSTTGTIGLIRIGSADDFQAIAGGNIQGYTSVGEVKNSLLDGGAKIGAIAIGSADAFTVNAKGDIASYTSKGAVKNSLIEAGANLGPVTIASADEFNIHIIGALTSYTSKGTVLDSAIDGVTAGKKFGAITVGSATHFDIHSHGNVASFTSKGDVVSSTIGALGTLGNVTITGALNDSFVEVAGKSAGVISVSSITDSAVFIGTLLEEPFASLPTKLAEFKNFGVGSAKVYSTLAGFVVTGKGVTGNSFINSRIAAGTLANVTVRLIDGAEPQDNGFAAGVRIGSYVRYTGPTAVGAVRVSNKTAPGTYDPVGGGVGIVGYNLKIVSAGLGGAAA
jgi:hypothetical protein